MTNLVYYKAKIEGKFDDFKNYCKNIFKFRKELVNYVPYDAMASLEFFNRGLKLQKEYMEKHGHTVNNEKYVREMEVAISYMDRILEDTFIEELEEERGIKLTYLYEDERKSFVNDLIQREKDVWDNLFKILRGDFLNSGIVCWWD